MVNDKVVKKTRLVLTDNSMVQTDNSTIFVSNNNGNRCMFCTLEIKNKSIGCPIKYIEIHVDNKHNEKYHSGEYITHGIFCSYNCAKAFALEKKKLNSIFENSPRYINIMANKELSHDNIVDVLPSPPIELLRMYGGYMSEEQYRSEINKISYIPLGYTITHPVTLVYDRKIINNN